MHYIKYVFVESQSVYKYSHVSLLFIFFIYSPYRKFLHLNAFHVIIGVCITQAKYS